MKNAKIFLVLLLTAAPLPLLAQQPSAEAEAPARARRGPVELLLQRRAELNLTQEQVQRLEEIRRRAEERNRPLITELMEIRRDMPRRGHPAELTPEQRARLDERKKTARPLLKRIRENHRAAMHEVGEVLTPEQKAQVREMVRERGERRGWRGRPHHHGDGPGPHGRDR